LNTILAAMKQLKPIHACMIAGCGCDYEWELHEIDMAVPLSPNEVLLKTLFFYHQSQRTE
jgi:glucosamine-6-phosphate deaminase